MMRCRVHSVAALGLCVAAFLAVPPASSAEPIQITSGNLDTTITGGPLTLAGEGFTFQGRVLHGVSPADACRPCLPGGLLSLDASWVGGDVRGDAVFNGIAYPDVGTERSLSAQVITFTGTAGVVPAIEGSTASLTAPFTFSGWFSLNEVGLLPGGNPPPPNVRADLFGAGMATVFLTRSDTVWVATRATYQFEETDPIPEPGTMLLVGTALSGLALRQRRRRQRAVAQHRL